MAYFPNWNHALLVFTPYLSRVHTFSEDMDLVSIVVLYGDVMVM